MQQNISKLQEYNNLCIEEIQKLQKEKKILLEKINVLFGKYHDDEKKRHDTEFEENELKNDVKMLKILVYRLNQHLEDYQKNQSNESLNLSAKLPISDLKIHEKWRHINSHVLEPLLNSYEEKLLAKSNIIRLYEKEINEISKKINNILEENEKMHEMYDHLRKNSELWINERERLNSQVEIFRFFSSKFLIFFLQINCFDYVF